MNESKIIAERIRGVAAAKGVGIGAMLKELNLSAGTLSYMSKSFPKVNTIVKIANYLGCSVGYLLGMEDSVCESESVIYNHNGRIVKAKIDGGQMDFLEKFILSLTDDVHITYNWFSDM